MDLSHKKFPSLAILGSMGIKNFKPSVRHKIANTCKNYNICNEPNLDTVTPRIGVYSATSQLSSRQINSMPSDAVFMSGINENPLIDIREDKSGANTARNAINMKKDSSKSISYFLQQTNNAKQLSTLPEVQLFTSASVT